MAHADSVAHAETVSKVLLSSYIVAHNGMIVGFNLLSHCTSYTITV